MAKPIGNLLKGITTFLGLGEPEMPEIEEPKLAPTPDDKTSRRKQERAMQRRYGGKGRASTVLTDETKLG